MFPQNMVKTMCLIPFPRAKVGTKKGRWKYLSIAVEFVGVF